MKPSGSDQMEKIEHSRFIVKVDYWEIPFGERCWEWTAVTSNGYGQMKVAGKNRYAHRLSYEWYVGEIPEGLTIDHLCRNRRCVNPGHLEPVTQRENIARGVGSAAIALRTGRCCRGHDDWVVNGDGRQCRTCRNEINKRWRLEHLDAVRARECSYKQANREKINACQRVWRARKKAEVR